MITAEERELAEHETQAMGRPWVLVRKHAQQPGLSSGIGRMYYTVTGGAVRAGSTVTVETLLKQGYRVEVVE